MEFIAPAHEGGSAAVATSANDEVWSVSELAFAYVPSAAVYAVTPSSGSVSGGEIVIVTGSGFEGESIKCRFGQEVVSGVYVGGDELCVTKSYSAPLLNASGRIHANRHAVHGMGGGHVHRAPSTFRRVVTLEVSASEGGFSTSKVEFAYQPAAVVFSVQPATGPSAGVGVVSVVRDHLLGDALCGAGSSEPSSAHVVSSALVKCEPPARAPGIAGVEIGTGDDGQQFSTSGAVYEYIEEAIVVGIAPREGPQSGGTIVRLALNTVDTSAVSACLLWYDRAVNEPRRRIVPGGVRIAGSRCNGPAMVSARATATVWDARDILRVRICGFQGAVAPASASTAGGTMGLSWAADLKESPSNVASAWRLSRAPTSAATRSASASMILISCLRLQFAWDGWRSCASHLPTLPAW